MISADESRKECKHMEKNLLTQGARGKNLERLSEEKGASLPCFSPEKGKHPGPYAHTPCSDPRLSDLYGPELVSQDERMSESPVETLEKALDLHFISKMGLTCFDN